MSCCAALFQRLAEVQTLRAQHFLDFGQGSFAEVLAAEHIASLTRVRSPSVLIFIFFRQLRLRTDSSKSVTDMSRHLAEPAHDLFFFGAVVHRQRGLRILQEKARALVVRVGLENTVEAFDGLVKCSPSS